jgi:hypothetical protein
MGRNLARTVPLSDVSHAVKLAAGRKFQRIRRRASRGPETASLASTSIEVSALDFLTQSGCRMWATPAPKELALTKFLVARVGKLWCFFPSVGSDGQHHACESGWDIPREEVLN